MTAKPGEFKSNLDVSLLTPRSVSSKAESTSVLDEPFNILSVILLAPKSDSSDVESVSTPASFSTCSLPSFVLQGAHRQTSSMHPCP